MKSWIWSIVLGAVIIGAVAFLIFYRDRTTFHKSFPLTTGPPAQVLITTERRILSNEEHVSKIVVKQGSEVTTVDSGQITIQDPNYKLTDLFELKGVLALRIPSQDGGHSRVALLCILDGKVVYNEDMTLEDYKERIGMRGEIFTPTEKSALLPLLMYLRSKSN